MVRKLGMGAPFVLFILIAVAGGVVNNNPFTVDCQKVKIIVDVNSSVPGWQTRVDEFPSGKITAKGILDMPAYGVIGKEIIFFVDVTPDNGPEGPIELPWADGERQLLDSANIVNGSVISEESFVEKCLIPPKTFEFGGVWYIYINFPDAAVILSAGDESTLYKMLDILYFEWKD